MIAPRVRLLVALAGAALLLAACDGGDKPKTTQADAGKTEASKPQTTPAQAAPALDRAAVEAIVRDYLVKNPGVIRDALIALEREQIAAQAEAQRKAIADNASALFKPEHAFVAGNPGGDVTVVEFFDYNCGFCRRALPDVLKLIDSDRNVRFIFREMPIFGEGSEAAARAALAAKNQGKYLEFHRAMMELPGQADEAKAIKIATSLGLDVEKLKADMKSPAIDAALEDTRDAAEKVGLQGTPLYIVRDQMLPGAPEDLYEQLQTRVNQARKDGCKLTAC